MTQLSDLYDADKSVTRIDIASMRAVRKIPHPLHGVEYADGVILCGRVSCEACRAYRGEKPYWKVQDEYERRRNA